MVRCDAYDLEKSADYRYRPLPLIPNRSKPVYPEDQLALVDCSSWIDIDALDGFPEEVDSILRSESRLSPQRIDAVVKGIKTNIERLRSAYRRQLRSSLQEKSGFRAARMRAEAASIAREAERADQAGSRREKDIVR